MRHFSQSKWGHQLRHLGWHWGQHSRVPLRRKPPQGRSSLIIKEKLGISDIETVEQIKENPYLQYFLGEVAYKNEAPFDLSMLSHFRKRIGMNLVNEINELIVKRSQQKDWIEEEDSQKKTKQRKLKITIKEN